MVVMVVAPIAAVIVTEKRHLSFSYLCVMTAFKTKEREREREKELRARGLFFFSVGKFFLLLLLKYKLLKVFPEIP